MCINCSFSIAGKPSEKPECKICFRNPKNCSIPFKPVAYKGHIIEKPIDMYISKELMEIIKDELRKMYEAGVKAGQIGTMATTSFPYTYWPFQYSTTTGGHEK